jgi:hypothetical protein
VTVFDKRLTPARPDLAAAHLEGQVEAARFVGGREMQVTADFAPLRRAPGNEAALSTQALYGEIVDVYETAGGFAWGQLRSDGYVGYLPASALAPVTGKATHRVSALRTYAFPGASIRLPPRHLLSMGSLIEARSKEDRFLIVARGLHIPSRHVTPVDEFAPDYVAVAERFVGTPYLWGGRTSLGLDCSGLAQIAMMAAGLPCPRDSDLQAKAGTAVAITEDLTGLKRGDRVFWKGHIGIMIDAERLLHANGFHMQVEIEPLRVARKRILGAGGGPITTIRRSERLGA